MKSMKKALSILLAMCLLLGMLPMSLSASAADDANLAEVFRLVNQERAKVGKDPYKSNAKLNEAAVLRAKELVQLYSHTRPDGSSCFTVLDEYGITFWAVGENIAEGYFTPKDVMAGWMNSPGHRGNILDEDNAGFDYIGIGHYQSAIFIIGRSSL